MSLKNRCAYSGYTSMFSPWFLREGEVFGRGHVITCGCGKKVKVRTGLSGGVVYKMIPHHNKLDREGTWIRN